jgi:hypothetical protein
MKITAEDRRMKADTPKRPEMEGPMGARMTLAAALAVAFGAGTARGEMAGRAAPPATFVQLWNGAGEKSLQDFRDKAILLEFFTTW